MATASFWTPLTWRWYVALVRAAQPTHRPPPATHPPAHTPTHAHTHAQVPDYTSVVATPMDFSTMQSKLEAGDYLSFEPFAADFELICRNCMTYNRADTVYYKQAEKLLDGGRKLIDAARAKWDGTL